MAKVSAEQFSREGDKYLGRSYDDMDCQEFYERCAEDAGLHMDLKGSNAWYREIRKNGWVGTPEECKKVFGSVPTGATLFIHAYDGGEEKRGYHDGLGNASHIGIVTHRNKGAIHSSASRGCVAESEFHDKTIKNGGWNIIGLYTKFTYGAKIDALLEDITGGGSGSDDPGQDQDEGQEEETMYTAILEGGNTNKPINIRKKPDGDLQDTVAQGSKVTVLSENGDWCKVRYGKYNKTGYVKGEFVVVDEDEPADEGDIPDEDFDGDTEEANITISVTAEEALYAVPLLEKLVEAIASKFGRG